MAKEELEVSLLKSDEEFSMSGTLKLSENSDNQRWTRKEKYVWFFTLLFGSAALYATRSTMPLVSPTCAKSLNWSKTEVGTVLSSFFWGYSVTQILGGYLSDRFGAERVLLVAGSTWALLTFFFQNIISWAGSDLRYVVLARAIFGGAQGVHFPALASISSRNLNNKERTFFFSATSAGSAMGALFTGTVGSYANEAYGWPYVFYIIGFFALIWVSVLKFYAMNLTSQKRKDLGNSSSENFVSNSNGQVPWSLYLKSSTLWACIFSHYCHTNCFFIILSWLPTYFNDNFPEAKSWIFNVVPWILMVPGTGIAWLFSRRLGKRGYSTGSIRKISEGIAMVTEAVCLIGVGLSNNYSMALFLCTTAMFSKSFHNFGSAVNAMDIAPKHSGSVFGIINTVGSTSGFIGVYFVGCILDWTGSWSAVFNITAVINLVGITVFALFGSGVPIV